MLTWSKTFTHHKIISRSWERTLVTPFYSLYLHYIHVNVYIAICLFIYLYKYVYLNYFKSTEIIRSAVVLLLYASKQSNSLGVFQYDLLMLSIKFTKGMRLYIIGRTRMCFKEILQHSMVFI